MKNDKFTIATNISKHFENRQNVIVFTLPVSS